jgi:hypothetical protein
VFLKIWQKFFKGGGEGNTFYPLPNEVQKSKWLFSLSEDTFHDHGAEGELDAHGVDGNLDDCGADDTFPDIHGADGAFSDALCAILRAFLYPILHAFLDVHPRNAYAFLPILFFAGQFSIGPTSLK